MTLRGKRKILNNNPSAQIAAIAEAFDGRLPLKPMPRRSPGAAWQDGGIYRIARLNRGRLYHFTSKVKPPTINIFSDALSAGGWLARTYHRKVSLPDLQASASEPIAVPTLAESQEGIICWMQDWRLSRSPTPTWQYCVVSPEGIKSGTTQGKPKPVEGYTGPLIKVVSIFDCKDLLRRAFLLDIQDNELQEAFVKVVKVPKVLEIQEHRLPLSLLPPDNNSN